VNLTVLLAGDMENIRIFNAVKGTGIKAAVGNTWNVVVLTQFITRFSATVLATTATAADIRTWNAVVLLAMVVVVDMPEVVVDMPEVVGIVAEFILVDLSSIGRSMNEAAL